MEGPREEAWAQDGAGTQAQTLELTPASDPEVQLWQLPEGFSEEDFGGLDLTYEHLRTVEEDQETTYKAHSTSSAFVTATAGVLIALVTRLHPSPGYIVAGFLALVTVGLGLAMRVPGKWDVRGPGTQEWETAHPVQLKRGLVALARDRVKHNRKRLSDMAGLLTAAYASLLVAAAAAVVQFTVDAID